MTPENRFNSLFMYYGAKHKVDWFLLWRQAKAESAFDPDAISHAGAAGLAQFMPKTWTWAKEMKWIPKHALRSNPEWSIKAQAAFMRWLLKRTKGCMQLALAAYNWGPGNVKRTFPKGNYDPKKVPTETRKYVKRIMGG